tara:strand:- start:952 stop:1443 length:492 start_codon:yes stop_codon:yes gene_type:complete
MILKKLNKNFITSLLFVCFIFLIDRLSKIYVIYLDKKYFGSEIFLSKFLNISLIWNEGIAFGLLSFEESYFYNFLTVLIFIIIIALIYMTTKSEGLKKYSYIMVLGGALGNIFDRILHRAVPDFIDFHVGSFHWFIFNVADIFITLGVFFMVIVELTDKKQKL